MVVTLCLPARTYGTTYDPVDLHLTPFDPLYFPIPCSVRPPVADVVLPCGIDFPVGQMTDWTSKPACHQQTGLPVCPTGTGADPRYTKTEKRSSARTKAGETAGRRPIRSRVTVPPPTDMLILIPPSTIGEPTSPEGTCRGKSARALSSSGKYVRLFSERIGDGSDRV